MIHSMNGINAIKRFKKRLYLSSNLDFKIYEFRENNLNNFINSKNFINEIKEQTKILELYHVSREDVCHNDCSATNSIFELGFKMEFVSVKNKGIYLSNHGRYSLDWLGWMRPVLICHVLYNEKSDDIERYESEIYSPGKSSEYIVKNTNIIYPAYQLKYYIHENYKNKTKEIKEKKEKLELEYLKNQKTYDLKKEENSDKKYCSIDKDDFINIKYI